MYYFLYCIVLNISNIENRKDLFYLFFLQNRQLSIEKLLLFFYNLEYRYSSNLEYGYSSNLEYRYIYIFQCRISIINNVFLYLFYTNRVLFYTNRSTIFYTIKNLVQSISQKEQSISYLVFCISYFLFCIEYLNIENRKNLFYLFFLQNKQSSIEKWKISNLEFRFPIQKIYDRVLYSIYNRVLLLYTIQYFLF